MNSSQTKPNSHVAPMRSAGDTPSSSLLPPPPIFKPKLFPMQRANSSSTSTPASNQALSASTSTPASNQANSPLTPTSSLESLNPIKKDFVFRVSSNPRHEAKATGAGYNSNFLTSSFVSTEEYGNKFLHSSPSISPMTQFTDIPFNDEEANSDSDTKPKVNRKKRRRRSSSLNNNKEELERKKRELKTQHSIIEKRRRVKMNREFEALKFLVPACRINILAGLTDGNKFDNSNLMHKLTILQSTVEYIKYLHLVIKLMKLQMLIPKVSRENSKKWFKKNHNLSFVDFDLDLQSYRNIENEFDFEGLFLEVWKNDGNIPHDWFDPITKEILKISDAGETKSPQLFNFETRDSKPVYSKPHSQPSQKDGQQLPKHPFLRSKIQTPSTLLEERIHENSEYRKNILDLQKDPKSFKLPLPAIIDKHPDLTLEELKTKNLSSGSILNLTPLKNPSFSNYPASLVPSHTPSQLQHKFHSSSLPEIQPMTSIYSSIPNNSNYTINRNVRTTLPIDLKSRTTNHITPNTPDYVTDTTSPEIRAASHLLMEFKSNKSRQPSINNILN